ncbi:MAG: hypothetical protein ACLSGS_07530 [Adlercreutzia sp.]
MAKDATILFTPAARRLRQPHRRGRGPNVGEQLPASRLQPDCIGRGRPSATELWCMAAPRDNVLWAWGRRHERGRYRRELLVAAGALVTEGMQVPEGSLVVGVPAVRRAPRRKRRQPRGAEATPPSAATWPSRASSTGAPHPRRRAHHRSRPGLASAALPVSP